MKNALWFLGGCVLTFAVTYTATRPKTNNAPSQNAIAQAAIDQLRGQQISYQNTIAQLQGQQVDLAKQRDTCKAKFDRFTILYDIGFLNVETKAWAIPADIEPVLVTGKSGTYSHYDPKTQTETVHFKGKPAQ
jgi:hypothetical protein